MVGYKPEVQSKHAPKTDATHTSIMSAGFRDVGHQGAMSGEFTFEVKKSKRGTSSTVSDAEEAPKKAKKHKVSA
jgi:hypothetical protein